MRLGLLKGITVSYGDQVLLREISAELPEGKCIAVVGANGAGKSTLLSLLAGKLVPTAGVIDWTGNPPTITYFRQEQEVEGQMDWSSSDAAIYRSKWHVPDHVDYGLASGGERMKMRLSIALAEKSRLLLLDEPTNHLDSDSLRELIEILQNENRTMVVVSHDRHFIDQIAEFVFELEHQELKVYEGNYTEYRKQKTFNLETQKEHYEQQQRKIARVESQLEQLGTWSEKAHRESRTKGGMKEYWRMKAKKRDVQIRSKRKRLEAELDKYGVEKPLEEIGVSFKMKGQQKKGRRVLELKDVRKAFVRNELFSNVNFTIQAGERIGLIGRNGSGKSTLFRMILGAESFEGDLWKTEGMTIGYLSQSVLDLPENLTMADYFYTESYVEQGLIRIHLTNLGFTAKHWALPLSALSMGERVKVKLMQFILEGTDVLLLDEPTNHLDLPSREALEKTLETFPGTLIFASHDRYFTERMAKGLLVFERGSIQKVPLSLNEWEERKELSKPNHAAEEKMLIETELQAILGKLSLLKPGDAAYAELDLAFIEISKRLRDIE